MAGMTEEIRKKATENRKRKSRILIFKAAEELAEERPLTEVTMKELAARAEVSVNTIKRQFQTVADVAYSLSLELESNGTHLSEKAKHSLQKAAKHSGAHEDREFVQQTLRTIEQLHDADNFDAIDRLESIYHELETEHADQYHLLAVTSYYLSSRYLHVLPGTEAVDSARSATLALKWAQSGLRHTKSDRRGRHVTLGKGLAFNASEAARRSCFAVCSSLDPEPDELTLTKAKVKVVAMLGVVASSKKEERDYEIKLNQPVSAAAAEFHRARAEAMAQQEKTDEIDAVLVMARTLNQLAHTGHTIPPRILVPFMPRMCAAQVAYQSDIAPETHQELADLRKALLATLRDHHDSATPHRALRTMFALAQRPSLGEASARNIALPEEIHLPDLILVSGYGVIGKLLIADLLRDISRAKTAHSDIYTASPPLLDILPEELMAAAKMYYTQAPTNTLVVGAAAVLADRARVSLKDDDVSNAQDTKPWPILDSGTLNIVLINQLSLGIITGKRPNPEEATAILREIHPLITTLESISGTDMGPDETPVPAIGLRFL